MLRFLLLTTFVSLLFAKKISLTNVWNAVGPCSFQIFDSNGYFTTYNLSYFNLPTGENEVEDDDPTRRWKYMFNTCGPLSQDFLSSSQYPNQCKYDKVLAPCETGYINQTSGECLKYVDITNVQNQDPAAIQLKIQDDTSSSQCFWLSGYDYGDSNSNTDPSVNYDITLLDTVDSARGITYHMMGGSYCKAAKKNRELQVHFKCPDSPRQYFSPSEESKIINETVAEYPTCTYNLLIESPLACPAQCIHKNRTKVYVEADDKKEKETLYSICNGKGICAMDEIEGTARCLCDEGYAGDKCDKLYDATKTTDETNGSIQVLVIFCIIILAIVFVLAAWLYNKLRNAQNEGLVGNSINQAADLAKPIVLDNEDDVVNANLIHEQDTKNLIKQNEEDRDVFPGSDEDRLRDEQDVDHEDPSGTGHVTV